jgi:hypothetical protein
MLRADGEPIVFTVNHGPLKDFSIEDTALKTAVGGADPEKVLECVLNAVMHKTGVSVTLPEESEFVAAVPRQSIPRQQRR